MELSLGASLTSSTLVSRTWRNIITLNGVDQYFEIIPWSPTGASFAVEYTTSNEDGNTNLDSPVFPLSEFGRDGASYHVGTIYSVSLIDNDDTANSRIYRLNESGYKDESLFPNIHDAHTKWPELIENGQFENDVMGWEGYSAAGSHETTIIYAGSGSMKVMDVGGGAVMRVALDTVIGTTYMLSGYVRSDSANTHAHLGRLVASSLDTNNATGYLAGRSQAPEAGVPADDEWYLETHKFIAVDTITYILCAPQAETGDITYFDNVTVKQWTGGEIINIDASMFGTE